MSSSEDRMNRNGNDNSRGNDEDEWVRQAFKEMTKNQNKHFE